MSKASFPVEKLKEIEKAIVDRHPDKSSKEEIANNEKSIITKKKRTCKYSLVGNPMFTDPDFLENLMRGKKRTGASRELATSEITPTMDVNDENSPARLKLKKLNENILPPAKPSNGTLTGDDIVCNLITQTGKLRKKDSIIVQNTSSSASPTIHISFDSSNQRLPKSIRRFLLKHKAELLESIINDNSESDPEDDSDKEILTKMVNISNCKKVNNNKSFIPSAHNSELEARQTESQTCIEKDLRKESPKKLFDSIQFSLTDLIGSFKPSEPIILQNSETICSKKDENVSSSIVNSEAGFEASKLKRKHEQTQVTQLPDSLNKKDSKVAKAGSEQNNSPALLEDYKNECIKTDVPNFINENFETDKKKDKTTEVTAKSSTGSSIPRSLSVKISPRTGLPIISDSETQDSSSKVFHRSNSKNIELNSQERSSKLNIFSPSTNLLKEKDSQNYSKDVITATDLSKLPLAEPKFSFPLSNTFQLSTTSAEANFNENKFAPELIASNVPTTFSNTLFPSFLDTHKSTTCDQSVDKPTTFLPTSSNFQSNFFTTQTLSYQNDFNKINDTNESKKIKEITEINDKNKTPISHDLANFPEVDFKPLFQPFSSKDNTPFIIDNIHEDRVTSSNSVNLNSIFMQNPFGSFPPVTTVSSNSSTVSNAPFGTISAANTFFNTKVTEPVSSSSASIPFSPFGTTTTSFVPFGTLSASQAPFEFMSTSISPFSTSSASICAVGSTSNSSVPSCSVQTSISPFGIIPVSVSPNNYASTIFSPFGSSNTMITPLSSTATSINQFASSSNSVNPFGSITTSSSIFGSTTSNVAIKSNIAINEPFSQVTSSNMFGSMTQTFGSFPSNTASAISINSCAPSSNIFGSGNDYTGGIFSSNRLPGTIHNNISVPLTSISQSKMNIDFFGSNVNSNTLTSMPSSSSSVGFFSQLPISSTLSFGLGSSASPIVSLGSTSISGSKFGSNVGNTSMFGSIVTPSSNMNSTLFTAPSFGTFPSNSKSNFGATSSLQPTVGLTQSNPVIQNIPPIFNTSPSIFSSFNANSNSANATSTNLANPFSNITPSRPMEQQQQQPTLNINNFELPKSGFCFGSAFGTNNQQQTQTNQQSLFNSTPSINFAQPPQPNTFDAPNSNSQSETHSRKLLKARRSRRPL